MMLFRNRLHELESENTAAFQSIQDTESHRKIDKMVKYLSASSISLYQIQIIRKDLIGMAIESEQNNLTLEEVIDSEPKEFCDEIIENSGEHARWEHFMQLLLEILRLSVSVFFIQFIFINSAPASYGIDYSFMVWLIVWCVFGVFLPDYMHRKFSVNRKPYGRWLGWLCRLLAFLSFVWLNGSPLTGHFIIRGNGWVILIIMSLLTVGTTAALNRHWDSCAQRFSGEISNL